MKIELIISTDTLGDTNSPGDNQNYADAVKGEIECRYPDADVSVELTRNVCGSSCYVSDDPTEEEKNTVNEIANRVWDRADY